MEQPAGTWQGLWQEGDHTVRAGSSGIHRHSKDRTVNAGNCPFMFLRKNKQSHDYYYLYSESEKAVVLQNCDMMSLCHMHQVIQT